MRNWGPELRCRLEALHVPPGRVESAVDEQSQHLDDRVAELMRGGQSEEQACRAALAELSDEDLRDGGWADLPAPPPQEPPAGVPAAGLVDGLRGDLRYAVRALAHRPLFAVTAALALALGIGATSAIFGAMDAVLLRPMPFPHADRLFVPVSDNPGRGTTNAAVTFADYEEWRREDHLFAEVALWVPGAGDLSGGGDPERVRVAAVTEEFFALIDIKPVVGRTLLASDHVPGAPLVTVIAHGLWQHRFGGAPSAVGQHVRLDGVSREIVGVLPPRGVWPDDAALFVPIVAAELADDVRTRRDNMLFRGLARLKPGVEPATTRARLATIAARLERDHPQIRKGWTNDLVPLREYIVDPGLARALYGLFGSVAGVLLIACLNVANLALVRGAGRARELAVRLSLGASRRRLVQQLVVEGLVITCVGTLAGIALAVLITKGLVAIAPAGTPFVGDIGVDGRVLLAALAAGLVAATLSGVVPAISTSAVRLGGALREGSAGAGSSPRAARLRHALVVIQVAAAVVLVSGSTLLVRSFHRLSLVDPGVTLDRVISGRISIPPARYATPARREQFAQDLVERLENAPEVESAALTSYVPAGGGGFALGRVFLAEGSPEPPVGADQLALWNTVTPHYFVTTGITLVEGRSFDDRDTASATPVMIVSRLFARQMFGEGSVLGKRIRAWRTDNVLREIVGVVEDVRYRRLAEPHIQQVYVPHAQDSQFQFMMVVARSRGSDPGALAPTVRQAVNAVDSELAVADLRTLAASASRSIATERYTTLLLSILAAAALALAALGIHGVTSYVFALRRREMGIRLSLGATRRNLYALVFRHGFRLTFMGLLVGLAGATAVIPWLRSLLFDTAPTDPAAWAAMFGILAISSLVACLLPARRAADADPTIALRAE